MIYQCQRFIAFVLLCLLRNKASDEWDLLKMEIIAARSRKKKHAKSPEKRRNCTFSSLTPFKLSSSEQFIWLCGWILMALGATTFAHTINSGRFFFLLRTFVKFNIIREYFSSLFAILRERLNSWRNTFENKTKLLTDAKEIKWRRKKKIWRGKHLPSYISFYSTTFLRLKCEWPKCLFDIFHLACRQVSWHLSAFDSLLLRVLIKQLHTMTNKSSISCSCFCFFIQSAGHSTRFSKTKNVAHFSLNSNNKYIIHVWIFLSRDILWLSLLDVGRIQYEKKRGEWKLTSLQ